MASLWDVTHGLSILCILYWKLLSVNKSHLHTHTHTQRERERERERYRERERESFQLCTCIYPYCCVYEYALTGMHAEVKELSQISPCTLFEKRAIVFTLYVPK